MTELAYDPIAVPVPTQLAEVVPIRTPETGHALLGARLEHAQALGDAGRLADAAAALAEVIPVPAGYPRLTMRVLTVEAWIALGEGHFDRALDGLQRARALTEHEPFTDTDRAELLFRLGACQLKRLSTATAISLLTLSLELFDHAADAPDRLRAHALVWRARGYQVQRDWEAARADVERAVQLAENAGDRHTVAHATFQASLIAEREGQWHLACFYTEEARREYLIVEDHLNVARLTNNLGGLTFLLGRPDEAIRHLEEAHRLAVQLCSTVDTAQALSSLAQVRMRTGDHAAAEVDARAALALLAGRPGSVDETGETQLVLGRALLEQNRFDEAANCFHIADQSFERIGSTSHRAAAWIAQGDLAHRRGDCEHAASLYRAAAESLQDFHF